MTRTRLVDYSGVLADYLGGMKTSLSILYPDMRDLPLNKISTAKADVVLVTAEFVRISIYDNVHLEREDVKEIHEAKLALLEKGKKHVVLMIAGKYATISREARDLSAEPEITENRMAKAMVVRSLAQKIIGDFFIRISKPAGHTRVFFLEADAIGWLRSFCKN
jgi:hypothetical protein